jgi:hypothetical protein
VIVLLELVLLGIVLSDSSCKQEEILAAQSITDAEQNKRIENMEKELRIIKSNSEFVINLITDKGYKE